MSTPQQPSQIHEASRFLRPQDPAGSTGTAPAPAGSSSSIGGQTDAASSATRARFPGFESDPEEDAPHVSGDFSEREQMDRVGTEHPEEQLAQQVHSLEVELADLKARGTTAQELQARLEQSLQEQDKLRRKLAEFEGRGVSPEKITRFAEDQMRHTASTGRARCLSLGSTASVNERQDAIKQGRSVRPSSLGPEFGRSRLNTEAVEYRTELEDELRQAGRKNDELADRLTEKDGELVELRAKHKELQKERDALQGKVQALEEELKDAGQARMSPSSTQKLGVGMRPAATSRQRCGTVDSTVTQWEGRLAAEEEVAKLQEEVASLKQELDRRQDQCEELKTCVVSQRKELATLKQKCAASESNHALLRTEVKSSKDRCKALQEQLEGAEARLVHQKNLSGGVRGRALSTGGDNLGQEIAVASSNSECNSDTEGEGGQVTTLRAELETLRQKLATAEAKAQAQAASVIQAQQRAKKEIQKVKADAVAEQEKVRTQATEYAEMQKRLGQVETVAQQAMTSAKAPDVLHPLLEAFSSSGFGGFNKTWHIVESLGADVVPTSAHDVEKIKEHMRDQHEKSARKHSRHYGETTSMKDVIGWLVEQCARQAKDDPTQTWSLIHEYAQAVESASKVGVTGTKKFQGLDQLLCGDQIAAELAIRVAASAVLVSDNHAKSQQEVHMLKTLVGLFEHRGQMGKGANEEAKQSEGAKELDTNEPEVEEASEPEAEANEVEANEVDASKTEASESEAGANEVGANESEPDTTKEPETKEVDTNEAGANEVGANESEASESEAGANEVGANESEADEVGASKTEASESEADTTKEPETKEVDANEAGANEPEADKTKEPEGAKAVSPAAPGVGSVGGSGGGTGGGTGGGSRPPSKAVADQLEAQGIAWWWIVVAGGVLSSVVYVVYSQEYYSEGVISGFINGRSDVVDPIGLGDGLQRALTADLRYLLAS